MKENARWIVGGFFLCFCSAFGQTFFISLFGGEIRAEYNLTNGEFGSLYMVATLFSAITLTYIGKVVDIITVSRSLLWVIPALAFATTMMYWSNAIILLFLTIYFLRLFGQGMMTHISITAMGKWYSGHRGRVVSIVTLGHQFSEAVLPYIFIGIIGLVGWRTSWLFAALFLILVALPIIFILMRVERVPANTDKKAKRLPAQDWKRGEVLRDSVFWLAMLGILASPAIGTTVFFHQDYLVELRGWEEHVFASAFILMAITNVFSTMICGQLVDRFGSPSLLPFVLLPLALGCFTLAYVPSQIGIFIMMTFVGLSYGGASVVFGAIWPEVYGIKHLGGVRSLTMALMVFSSALGPGLSGILIDFNVSYLTQFAYMGLYCIAASIIMVFVSQKYKSRALVEGAN